MSSRVPLDRPAAAGAPWFSDSPVLDVEQGPAALHATGDTADWWFKALDQRPVSVGGEPLALQVVGIHGDGPNFWIQLESADSLRCGVLRVLAGTRLNDALAMVGAILVATGH